MPGRIFINYRRDDDAEFTQALFQRLEQEFSSDYVFMDVEGHIQGKGELAGRHRLSDAFKDGHVWALALVYFALTTCVYAVLVRMPTIIQELCIDRNNRLKVGLLSMIPWGASIVSMIWWGSHSDRTGERRWHCAAGILVVMGGLLLLAIASQSPIVSIAALTLITIGWAGALCTFWSLPTAFLSGTAAAAGIAWINSVGNLGGYLSPNLFGTIRTAAHGAAEAALFTLAVIALVGALIVIFLPRTQHAGAAPIVTERK